MTVKEVRSILKEFYIEKAKGLGTTYYEYKEVDTLNCAFRIYQDYAWELKMSTEVQQYGTRPRYSTVMKDISNEVYDSSEKLKEKIYEMKNKYKIALSECKKYEIEKEFK